MTQISSQGVRTMSGEKPFGLSTVTGGTALTLCICQCGCRLKANPLRSGRLCDPCYYDCAEN